MEDVMRRYSAALLGFGFVAVWAGLGFMSAVYCLIGCAVSYLAPGIARRRGVAGPVRLSQASLRRRSPARPSRARRPPDPGEGRRAPPAAFEAAGDDAQPPQLTSYGW
jgi:hypothetical protein